MQVSRDREFAPLKNAAGAASATASHCRSAVAQAHIARLRAAGAVLADETTLEVDVYGRDLARVEISPLLVSRGGLSGRSTLSACSGCGRRGAQVLCCGTGGMGYVLGASAYTDAAGVRRRAHASYFCAS